MKKYITIVFTLVFAFAICANAQMLSTKVNECNYVEYPVEWGHAYKAELIVVPGNAVTDCRVFAMLHTPRGIGYIRYNGTRGTGYARYEEKNSYFFESEECLILEGKVFHQLSNGDLRPVVRLKKSNLDVNKVNGAYFEKNGNEWVLTPAYFEANETEATWGNGKKVALRMKINNSPRLSAYCNGRFRDPVMLKMLGLL
ncbi:MAG: hypothetical protein IKS23_03665 [Alphaproteobacteria bacterium]|nr:hypothetical protein [Alphaproteobacteria bacterium]